jgi:hypothetical protein
VKRVGTPRRSRYGKTAYNVALDLLLPPTLQGIIDGMGEGACTQSSSA